MPLSMIRPPDHPGELPGLLASSIQRGRKCRAPRPGPAGLRTAPRRACSSRRPKGRAAAPGQASGPSRPRGPERGRLSTAAPSPAACAWTCPAASRTCSSAAPPAWAKNGETLYPGDFRAQLWRTYHNLTALLQSEGATWQDIVRTTCYIRDIERDYDEFNRVRNEFFRALGLDPFPASTAIQARICRSDLLVEIEAMAILVR
jgi:enamine deaminase RidA (YjgF/YER057c/UK114 family)